MPEQEKELYKKHRPVKLSQLVGQDEAIETLKQMAKGKSGIPHFLLMSGPAGCGKTTLARILRHKLKCSDRDFRELNCADFRGIDVVRDIRSAMMMSPMEGETRVWLIDEAGKLTNDAQTAFLKMLEDTPPHVYFMMCTTEPQKLLKTIKSRATEIVVKAVRADKLQELIHRIHEEETGVGLSEEVCERIAEEADGSPRKALVLLNQVIGIDGEDKQLAAISGGVASHEAIELARALMNPKTTWSTVAGVLGGIEGLEQQAEGIRRLLLGYMSTVAVKNAKQAGRVCDVIGAFEKPFYDTGKAGLVLACWDATHGE